MAQLTIDDYDIHAEKTVDSNGRVYVGKDYAGKDVRVTLEVLNDE